MIESDGFQKEGDLKMSPTCYRPYSGDPQKGTLNFGKPPFRQTDTEHKAAKKEVHPSLQMAVLDEKVISLVLIVVAKF